MPAKRKFKGNKSAADKARLAAAVPPKFKEIDRLIGALKYDEAIELLEKLEQDEPDDVETLRRLFTCAVNADDQGTAFRSGDKLIHITPDAPLYAAALGDLYMHCGYLVHAVRQYKGFIEKFPEDPASQEIKDLIAEIETDIEEEQQASSFEKADFEDATHSWESARILLEQDKVEEAHILTTDLAHKYPKFILAHLTIVEIACTLADIEEAYRHLNIALEIEPESTSALAMAIHLGKISNKSADDLKALASKLVESPGYIEMSPLLQLETLTFLGDNQGVIEIFNDLTVKDFEESERILLWHYAAVAHANIGDDKQATSLWKNASAYDPNNPLYHANLHDLKLPAGKRHGAIAFEVTSFIPAKQLNKLDSIVAEEEFADRDDPDIEAKVYKALIDAVPIAVTAYPAVMEFCPPAPTRALCDISAASDNVDVKNAMFEFVKGKRGADSLRLYLLGELVSHGYECGATVKLWIKGEQRDITPPTYQINRGAIKYGYSADIISKLKLGHHLLAAERFEEAEAFVRERLTETKDCPTFYNYLLIALHGQDKIEEADELTEEIYKLFPDYLFGRTNLAINRARANKLDEARELLKPLIEKKKLHISEFRSLMLARLTIVTNDSDAKSTELEDLIEIASLQDADFPLLDDFNEKLKLMRKLDDGKEIQKAHKKGKK